MGTNYDLLLPPKRSMEAHDVQIIQEHANAGKIEQITEYMRSEGLIAQTIHIGKYSAGWKFCWSADYRESYEAWVDSLMSGSGRIVDEYGTQISFSELATLVESSKDGLWCGDARYDRRSSDYDSKIEYLDDNGYRFMRGEFS